MRDPARGTREVIYADPGQRDAPQRRLHDTTVEVDTPEGMLAAFGQLHRANEFNLRRGRRQASGDVSTIPVRFTNDNQNQN